MKAHIVSVGVEVLVAFSFLLALLGDGKVEPHRRLAFTSKLGSVLLPECQPKAVRMVGQEFGKCKVASFCEEAVCASEGVEIVWFNCVEAFRSALVDPTVDYSGDLCALCSRGCVEDELALPVLVLEVIAAPVAQ